MQNREITYYYLLADDILNHYYSLADGIPEDSFVKSGLEQKHLIHFNVHANNNAFLTHLAEQSDLKNLTTILQKQLARYLEHADGNSHDLKIGWLKQTVKICKDAYHQRKKKSQIWLEAAEWCEKELTENLKTILGQQINGNSGEPKGGLDSKLETQKKKAIDPKGKNKVKLYSHRQIAIACWAMRVLLKKDNAPKILKKYSTNKSVAKLLREQINSPSTLTKLTHNKTSDTKHLKSLIAAKELINGTRVVQNKQEAITKITRIITAFQTSYESEY